MAKLRPYCNKTKIPEYLQPLPPITYEVYRKYRKDFHNPLSLLEICCNVIEIKVHDPFLRRSGRPNWGVLKRTLTMCTQIVPDSTYHFCNIEDYPQAVLFLKRKSKGGSILELLRNWRIVMDETSQERRISELSNHWGRIPPPAMYPCVMFGRPSKKERLWWKFRKH